MNSPAAGKIIGIDLGTTFSAVAYVNEEGIPTIISSPHGAETLPSVVLIDGQLVTVGQEAMNQWILREENVCRWIKQAMGREDFLFQGKTPVEISAEILKTLKQWAEAFLGDTVNRAVITCPAYFNMVEIENTKRAGELAGFLVEEIIKEPTAAAVCYGVDKMTEGQVILVSDLGGGTYDSTILMLDEGTFRPLASTGSRELGGHNWTMDLVDLAAEKLEQQIGEDPRNDLAASNDLYEKCEQAKRNFSQMPSEIIACHYNGQLYQAAIERDEFEQKTEWLISKMVMYARDALTKVPRDRVDKIRLNQLNKGCNIAGRPEDSLTWADIDLILLVGGSSRLRRVSEALEQESGKKPTLSSKPDLMVALGAAILGKGKVKARPRGGLMAAPKGGLVAAPKGGLIDISFARIIPRNLGTRVIIGEGKDAFVGNSMIIPMGTEILESGLSCSSDYEISCDNQKYFDIPVVEFDHETDDPDAKAGWRFHCPAGVRAGEMIRITFHYDKSGIVTPEASHLKTGRKLTSERINYEEPKVSDIVFRINPRFVVFAVDISWSMEGEKLDSAKTGVIENSRTLFDIYGGNCQIAVITFGTGAEKVCDPTSDLGVIESRVNTIAPSGTTQMDDGINLAMQYVSRAPSGWDRDIVLVTDGMPDTDRTNKTLKAADKARNDGINLCTLGIGSQDVDEDFLKKMTDITLVIEPGDNMASGIATLLRQAEKKH